MQEQKFMEIIWYWNICVVSKILKTVLNAVSMFDSDPVATDYKISLKPLHYIVFC